VNPFVDIRHFAEIDSTNRWLREAAATGQAAHGTVAIADRQTAGRGRLDRAWIAPPGSALLMSVLVDPAAMSLPVDRWPMVSFCMAFAVQEVANGFPDLQTTVSLKWPNDVIVVGDGHPGAYRKLAGVLVEVSGSRLVVGVGVNLQRPANVDPSLGVSASPVWLSELTKLPVEREAFASAVLASFANGLDLLASSPDLLLDSYRTVLSTIGWLVGIESHGKTWTGEAVGLDAGGRLVVVNDEGTHHVDASEVVHVRPVSP